jgi:hypothetical protein
MTFISRFRAASGSASGLTFVVVDAIFPMRWLTCGRLFTSTTIGQIVNRRISARKTRVDVRDRLATIGPKGRRMARAAPAEKTTSFSARAQGRALDASRKFVTNFEGAN